MKRLLYGLIAIFTAFVLVLAQPRIGLAQKNVVNLAKQVTVRIESATPGSGVIIGKNNNTYYVLTAYHIVEVDRANIKIIAPDQSEYVVSMPRDLPGAGTELDLAVVEFTSNKDYAVAPLGDSESVDIGDRVWVAGFPKEGQVVTNRELNVVPGEIRSRLLQPTKDGYALSYTNPTEPGMSGGPVLNENGLLIGIHGKGEKDTKNFAVPINIFTRVASQMGISVAKGGNPVIATPSNTNNPSDLASTCKQLKADYDYWEDKKGELHNACFFNEDPAECSQEKAAGESIRQAERQWTQLGCSGPIWALR